MAHYCPVEGCNEELLVVYIKGLPGKGMNVLSPTIFRYCPAHQKFYGMVPVAKEELEAIEVSVTEYQGLTQIEMLDE